MDSEFLTGNESAIDSDPLSESGSLQTLLIILPYYFLLDYKEIIKQVSGKFDSGQLVGVLGPSGNQHESIPYTINLFQC